MFKKIGMLAVVIFVVCQSAARPADTAAASQVKAIDTDCSAIQNAVMALKPIHLALLNSNWKVLSDADYTVAERTHASITLVDAWKQGNNYAWIHSHSFSASGTQRATQLCFRQANGSLERARQAADVPSLGAAGAKAAYFSSDGTLIFKVSGFEVNDPAVAKTIKELPYYSVLP
jgi:hypothetical protein